MDLLNNLIGSFSSLSVVEITATVFGILYVLLLMRENIWCWLAGNINVALVGYSCWSVHLFADMSLQIVYFILGVYGYWQWARAKKQGSTELSIGHIDTRTMMILALVTVAVASIVYFILSQVATASFIVVDSVLFALSLSATYLQAKKYVENWWLWIPINCSYAIVYGFKGLSAYVLLSLVFAFLSIRGLREWNRVIRSASEPV